MKIKLPPEPPNIEPVFGLNGPKTHYERVLAARRNLLRRTDAVGEREQHRRDTAVRFVPYDCEGCFKCWKTRTCIYSQGPMTEEEISKAETAERELMGWGGERP